MTNTQKLRIIAVLASGSLIGCPAARAAVGQTAQHPPAARPAIRRNCPSRDEISAALGQASRLMAQARYPDAAAALGPLAESGCDPRASLLYAASFDAQGQPDKATAVLEQAHTDWPLNNSIAASLARAEMNAGRPDKAGKALQHFAATPSTPQQELEEAVLVYFATHRLEAARGAAAVEYKLYPTLHTLLLLANALQLEGRYPDVNRLLGAKRDIYADSPEFFVTLAESESDAAIYADAVKDLQRAIQLNAKLPQAHYLLGYVWLRQNHADAAIAEFHAAIELGFDQPRTYYQLALALRARQDETGEEQALHRALAADSNYAPAQCELGRILLEQHRPEEAVSHLTAAVESNPRSEEGYFLLAKAFAGLGQKDKSMEMVKRLTTVRRENRTTAQNGNEAPAPESPPEKP